MKNLFLMFLIFSSIIFSKNEKDIPEAQIDLSSLFQNTSKDLTQVFASQIIPSVLDNYSYLLQALSAAERQCLQQYQMKLHQKIQLLSHGYADIVKQLLAQKYLTNEQIWALWKEYKNKRWWDWNNEKNYTENDLKDALEKRKQQRKKQEQADEKRRTDEQKKLDTQKLLQNSDYVSSYQSSSDQAQLQLLPDELQFFEDAYELLENYFQDERSIERKVVRRQAIEQTKNDGFMQYAVAYNLTPQAQAYLNLYEFDPSDYGHCFGTALQQQFHSEVISIFEKAARLGRELPYRSRLLNSSLLLADAAHEANKFEQIEMVAALNDLSFQFLDTIETYSLAALRGAVKGAMISVQALCHPLDSIESLARGLHYVFETAALNDCAQEFGFEDLYVELCDQRNTEIAAAFSALGQKILQGSAPEIVEELCSFGASFYVPGKIFQALGSVLGVLHATIEVVPVIENSLTLAGDAHQVGGASVEIIQTVQKMEQAMTQHVTKQAAQKMFRTTKKPKHPKKLARAALEGSIGKPTEPRTLQKKMEDALRDAKKTAYKERHLSDGRIRYYEKERPSNTPGPTRGRSYVTEYDEKTNRIRQWTECYDHFGNVNRVRPKMINGKEVISQHYPATYQDQLDNLKGSKWRILENNVV